MVRPGHKWTPAEGADGYLVRFGPDKDFLNQTIQVKGGDCASLLVHVLTRGVEYCFTVQAYNENGISEISNIN